MTVRTFASFLALVFIGSPVLANHCTDPNASDPGLVRIQVFIESAAGSASIDGDNFLFDNEADLRPEVSINGGPFVAGGYVGDDDTPQFSRMFEAEVPRLLRPVPIRIRLRDSDDPDDDDWIDLDPAGGCNQNVGGDDPDCTLELSFDSCCYTFTGDGITGASGCENGNCAGGGDGHWLGPGDHDEHARIRVRVQTGDSLTTCTEADVSVTGVEFVQVVDRPGFAVGGRGSILRVTMASTFDGEVNTSVVANIGDSIGPDATEQRDVVLSSCLARTENFFVSDPVVVEFSRAHYGATIDPNGILPYTDPCVRVNDGSDRSNEIDIRPARDLSVVYQRIYYLLPDCPLGAASCSNSGLVPFADAVTEAADADRRIRGFFPAPGLESFVDPLALSLPAPDIILGPRTEIQFLSEAAALLGLDRVVGLVPFNWIDAHGYIPIPLGTTGVSNGKIGPHFVIAERIPGELGFTPVHEMGHTFGLSDEPCSVSDLALWELFKCEDEYETDVFPGRPAGGFQGTGFDVAQGVEAEGTCFMDSDRDAWISNNDFESFVRKMAPGRDPRVLVVKGSVTNEATGDLLSAVGLDAGIPDRGGLTHSPFSLVVRDAGGAVLGQYGIFDDMKGEDENNNGILESDEILGDYDNNGVPDRLPVSHPLPITNGHGDDDNDGIPDATEHAEFALVIPWPISTASIDLVGPGGAVIDTLAIDTGSPPVIELLEPLGEVRLNPADPGNLIVPVRWRLPGGGALNLPAPGPAAAPVQAVTIASSYDGGATWLPRAHRISGGAYVIDARDIQAPLTMQLRVMALVNGPAGIDTTVPDMDHDRCPDSIDPSPTAPDTLDSDADGIPNVCDRCLMTRDPLQTDADQDGYGDACDGDYDNDGIVEPEDDAGGFAPCLGQSVFANPACYDRDFDGDGVVTAVDHDSFFMPLLTQGMPGPSALVPDADSDGVGDMYDCAPSDPSAFKLPAEVAGLMVDPSVLGSDHVAISWNPLATMAGSGTVYDVLTGTLASLTSTGGYASHGCLSIDEPASGVVAMQSQPGPPQPNGWWYLVRGENTCGSGTWGDGSGMPDPRDPLDQTTLCTPPAPVLGIVKTDSPDPVMAGGTITYTLSYSNTGMAAATGVVLSDSVPTSTTFVSASGGGTPDPSGNVIWNLGTLPAGSAGVVQLVVRVGSTAANGAVISNVSYAIDSAETAPVGGPPVTTTVTSLPSLAVTKTDSPDPVPAGGTITYTLSYSNTGTAAATGVVLTDLVPSNTTFVSATGGGTPDPSGNVIWNLGTLPAGSAGAVQLVVRVGSTVANGAVISNISYSIDSAEIVPVGGPSVTTTVTSLPSLMVSKTDSPDPVIAGGTITYTLSYSNTGTAAATGVVLTDLVPSNTTFVSAGGGGSPDPGENVIWSLGTLPAGAAGSVQLVVRVGTTVSPGTTITNSLYSIDSNQTTPVAGPVVTTTVAAALILAIDLDVATPTVIDSARALSATTTTLDVGVIVDARGSTGVGDVARVAFGVINAFNTGGATVTSITPLAITDIIPPAASPNNATFAALAGEFQFGGAIVERGVPGGSFAAGPLQYARFRITFGSRPAGSTVRVFLGDAGPGSGAVRNGPGLDISGDRSPDGTPVGGVAGSDQGVGAGIDYKDAVISF